jgi:hypothetical protein
MNATWPLRPRFSRGAIKLLLFLKLAFRKTQSGRSCGIHLLFSLDTDVAAAIRRHAERSASPTPGREASRLTDSSERRHEGRAFIQHGQNRVSGLGRKHQDDPINAGVTVAF